MQDSLLVVLPNAVTIFEDHELGSRQIKLRLAGFINPCKVRSQSGDVVVGQDTAMSHTVRRDFANQNCPVQPLIGYAKGFGGSRCLLCPYLVGATGFEPATSTSRT